MTKLHTLRALTLGLLIASSSAGCGLFGGGSASGPAVATVAPSEGNAGTMVMVTLDNFNEKRDILLFGGVPVRAVDPVAAFTKNLNSDEKATKSVSRETPQLELVSAQKTLTRLVKVPNLEGGPVAITIRRGDYESDSVTFTILSSNGDSKNDASATAGSDTNTDSDTINPTDTGSDVAGATTGGTTGTDDQGSAMGHAGEPPAGEETPPAETPPPHAAYAALSQGPSNFGFNYVKLNWSVAYVDSAFIRVPVNYYYADVISFGQFHGSSAGPFPFGASDNEGGLLEKLASSLLDDDHGNMPFNYCSVPMFGRTNTPHPCYTSNPNATNFNYVDIMIPLASGEKSKSGTWKFRLPAHVNTFTVYYRDWSKNVHHRELNISNPF